MTSSQGASAAAGAIVRRTIVIENERGLHARTAAKFVQVAGHFEADVTVHKDGAAVSGRSASSCCGGISRRRQRAIATVQVCAFYPQETSRDAPAGVATGPRRAHGENGVCNAARLRAARRNAATSRPLRVAGLPPAA